MAGQLHRHLSAKDLALSAATEYEEDSYEGGRNVGDGTTEVMGS